MNRKKLPIVIMTSLLISAVILALVFVRSFKKVPINTSRILFVIIMGEVIVAVLVYLKYMVQIGVKSIRQAIHNMRTCDDELFEKINKYKKRWNSDDEFYNEQIKTINYYYREDGEVDELIKNKEIVRLYKRAEYLNKNLSLYDDVFSTLSSLVISAAVTIGFYAILLEDIINTVFGIVVILVSFFATCILKYFERGQLGSYRFFLDEHERNLLMDKIHKYEDCQEISDFDMQILKTKEIVLDELNRLFKNKKYTRRKRNDIKKDIKVVEGLNLLVDSIDESQIQEIIINGERGYLLYKMEDNSGDKTNSSRNFINKDYLKLYEVVCKYGLI